MRRWLVLGTLTATHPSERLAAPHGDARSQSRSKPISLGWLFQSLKIPNSWRQVGFKFKFGSQMRSFHPTVHLSLETRGGTSITRQGRSGWAGSRACGSELSAADGIHPDRELGSAAAWPGRPGRWLRGFPEGRHPQATTWLRSCVRRGPDGATCRLLALPPKRIHPESRSFHPILCLLNHQNENPS